jgi:hypothetical protein
MEEDHLKSLIHQGLEEEFVAAFEKLTGTTTSYEQKTGTNVKKSIDVRNNKTAQISIDEFGLLSEMVVYAEGEE